jgi:hypothetical protein
LKRDIAEVGRAPPDELTSARVRNPKKIDARYDTEEDIRQGMPDQVIEIDCAPDRNAKAENGTNGVFTGEGEIKVIPNGHPGLVDAVDGFEQDGGDSRAEEDIPDSGHDATEDLPQRFSTSPCVAKFQLATVLGVTGLVIVPFTLGAIESQANGASFDHLPEGAQARAAAWGTAAIIMNVPTVFFLLDMQRDYYLWKKGKMSRAKLISRLVGISCALFAVFAAYSFGAESVPGNWGVGKWPFVVAYCVYTFVTRSYGSGLILLQLLRVIQYPYRLITSDKARQILAIIFDVSNNFDSLEYDKNIGLGASLTKFYSTLLSKKTALIGSGFARNLLLTLGKVIGFGISIVMFPGFVDMVQNGLPEDATYPGLALTGAVIQQLFMTKMAMALVPARYRWGKFLIDKTRLAIRGFSSNNCCITALKVSTISALVILAALVSEWLAFASGGALERYMVTNLPNSTDSFAQQTVLSHNNLYTRSWDMATTTDMGIDGLTVYGFLVSFLAGNCANGSAFILLILTFFGPTLWKLADEALGVLYEMLAYPDEIGEGFGDTGIRSVVDKRTLWRSESPVFPIFCVGGDKKRDQGTGPHPEIEELLGDVGNYDDQGDYDDQDRTLSYA